MLITDGKTTPGIFHIEKYNDAIRLDAEDVIHVMEAMLNFLRKELEREKKC
jgi:hypothetical protein